MLTVKKTRGKEGTMHRCPLKFSNPYPPDERECEQEECRWWIARFQMCAIALGAYAQSMKAEGASEDLNEQPAMAGKQAV
ncbi:MAG: hypothetical protein ACUVTR_06615 [Dehalococcoidia bacterium]